MLPWKPRFDTICFKRYAVNRSFTYIVIKVDPLALEIFFLEHIDTKTHARIDTRTPARVPSCKLTISISDLEVIKLVLCSTQLSTTLILLINVKCQHFNIY